MASNTTKTKKKERDSMSLRLPLHRIDELRAIGRQEDRPVSWLIKRGIDLLIESYSREKPTSTQTQQAPVVTAQFERERLMATIAELEAKQERKRKSKSVVSQSSIST